MQVLIRCQGCYDVPFTCDNVFFKDEILSIYKFARIHPFDENLFTHDKTLEDYIFSLERNGVFTNNFDISDIKFGDNIHVCVSKKTSAYRHLLRLKIDITNENFLECSDLETVQCFIDLGVDINIKNKHGNNLLHYSAQSSSRFDISKLLCNSGIDVDTITPQGKTALHFAAENNNKKCCHLLIRYGANVNAKTLTENTPLILATKKKFIEMCKILIMNGAIVDEKKSDGKNALFYAKRYNSLRITSILRQAGIDDDDTVNF